MGRIERSLGQEESRRRNCSVFASPFCFPACSTLILSPGFPHSCLEDTGISIKEGSEIRSLYLSNQPPPGLTFPRSAISVYSPITKKVLLKLCSVRCVCVWGVSASREESSPAAFFSFNPTLLLLSFFSFSLSSSSRSRAQSFCSIEQERNSKRSVSLLLRQLSRTVAFNPQFFPLLFLPNLKKVSTKRSAIVGSFAVQRIW